MSEKRQQYHFRPSENGFYAWDVNKIIEQTTSLVSFDYSISEIAELDELWWFQDSADMPTPRSVFKHIILAMNVEMKWPIILDPENRLIDGMHRLLRALLEGKIHIKAVRLPKMPEPDYVDVKPSELNYF